MLEARVMHRFRLQLRGVFAAAILAACAGAEQTELFEESSFGSGRGTTGGASSGKPTEDQSPTEPRSGSCAVSFENQILPALGQHACGNAVCHGGEDPPSEPSIRLDDSAATYKAFTKFRLDGQPYVRPRSDPDESAIDCHLSGECGQPMPPPFGRVSETLIVDVRTWLTCGAPLN